MYGGIAQIGRRTGVRAHRRGGSGASFTCLRRGVTLGLCRFVWGNADILCNTLSDLRFALVTYFCVRSLRQIRALRVLLVSPRFNGIRFRSAERNADTSKTIPQSACGRQLPLHKGARGKAALQSASLYTREPRRGRQAMGLRPQFSRFCHNCRLRRYIADGKREKSERGKWESALVKGAVSFLVSVWVCFCLFLTF